MHYIVLLEAEDDWVIINNSEQETEYKKKKFINRVKMGRWNPSLAITYCHP